MRSTRPAVASIGAARSADRGLTWDDLGVVLDAPLDSAACGSANRFVLGGVGDVSALLDTDRQDVYLYFSQYGRDAGFQGVGVARLAWADRDAPAGKASVWNEGAWLPVDSLDAEPSVFVERRFSTRTLFVQRVRPSATYSHLVAQHQVLAKLDMP